MLQQVNAVNPHGTMSGAICRDAAGRLGGLTSEWRAYAIPEMVFTEWLREMEKKYRNVP